MNILWRHVPATSACTLYSMSAVCTMYELIDLSMAWNNSHILYSEKSHWHSFVAPCRFTASECVRKYLFRYDWKKKRRCICMSMNVLVSHAWHGSRITDMRTEYSKRYLYIIYIHSTDCSSTLTLDEISWTLVVFLPQSSFQCPFHSGYFFFLLLFYLTLAHTMYAKQKRDVVLFRNVQFSGESEETECPVHCFNFRKFEISKLEFCIRKHLALSCVWKREKESERKREREREHMFVCARSRTIEMEMCEL